MSGKRIVFLHLGVDFVTAQQTCRQLGGIMPLPQSKEDFDLVFRPGIIIGNLNVKFRMYLDIPPFCTKE